MTNKNIAYMKLKKGEEFVNKNVKSFVEICNNLSMIK